MVIEEKEVAEAMLARKREMEANWSCILGTMLVMIMVDGGCL